MDPIHQFEIKTIFPIAKIGNVEIAFTNSALYMLIAVGIIALLMIGFTSRRAMVPGRFQALAEVSYEFIATTLQRTVSPRRVPRRLQIRRSGGRSQIWLLPIPRQ